MPFFASPAHGAALLFSVVAALPAFAADRPAVLPDTIAQRVVACTSCHAKEQGNDAFFPRISGKPAGYLYNQLVNFRDGRRQYPLMTYMVDHLPDGYLHEIADYFSSQHLAPPAVQPSAVSQAVLDRGQQLVTKGDAAIKVPACIACHGDKLTGVAPTIPGLAGLPRDYVNAQFGAWRNKTRRAHAPDCMAEIANRLSLADVAAVSSWLGARPLPADPAPATAIARPLPIRCGSLPD
ncbi:MAG: Cytochrome [Massilia sp.]|nr:Cytochrome [Massilia sp.]